MVEFKREFAKVVQFVVEIGERLEQAVREIACRLEHLEGGLRAGEPQVDVCETRCPVPELSFSDPYIKDASRKTSQGCCCKSRDRIRGNPLCIRVFDRKGGGRRVL